MKTQKTFHIFIILLICSCSQTSNLNNGSEANNWRYELEAQNTGTQGTYLVKVWSFSKSPDVAIEHAPKKAVHGVLFKGFPNNGRIEGQNALIRDNATKVENEEYFSMFFSDGGPYRRYVTLTNSGSISEIDRLKIGSGENAEYKIGMVVSINVADLRKRLEEDGVIEPLDAGF